MQLEYYYSLGKDQNMKSKRIQYYKNMDDQTNNNTCLIL